MSIKNPQSEEFVYQYIKNLITQKVLFPGSRILQETVAQKTGYSRTPIRSAFLRLENDGLINFTPKLGATVVNPTIREIEETYECRCLIETEVTRMACDKATDRLIQKLDECHKLLREQYKTYNMQNFIEKNREFHTLILKAAEKPYYEKFLNELYNKCDIYVLFYDKYKRLTPDESCTLKDHERIIDAIKARDKDACAEAVRNHLETTLNELNISYMDEYMEQV